MKTEKTLEILKELKEDPKAKEIFESLKNSKSADDIISVLEYMAGNRGYDIKAEEIREALESKDMIPLEDDALDEVAGGQNFPGVPSGECDHDWVEYDRKPGIIFDTVYYRCSKCNKKGKDDWVLFS